MSKYITSLGKTRGFWQVISEYLDASDFLESYLSGFRTETARVFLEDDPSLTMNDDQVSMLILLDFSSAFNTTDH